MFIFISVSLTEWTLGDKLYLDQTWSELAI